MTPVLVSVDKAGDLKIGRKKCRLYKKDEVVKVAKKYGISTEKKTVKELCGAIKNSAKNTPKSAKNVQNVNTPKKMNTKEMKAQLRKMQPLIQKLASQLGTKKMQLTKKQKRLKEMKKEVKRLKPYTKITMEVRELATQEYAKQMGIQAPWRFTTAYELERVGYIIRDAPAFYKRWMDKTNPKIQKARTEMELQIRTLENEIPVLETEIPELKDKVAALRAKYKNMKEAVTVPKPSPKPRSPNPAAVARARANIIAKADKLPDWMGDMEVVKMEIAKASPLKVMKMARELRHLQ